MAAHLQETWRCRTQKHGLVVDFNTRLKVEPDDLRGVSNLNDAMIP